MTDGQTEESKFWVVHSKLNFKILFSLLEGWRQTQTPYSYVALQASNQEAQTAVEKADRFFFFNL